ncbi:MAG: dTDP-glucose 4,6-dehydratase [Cytophagales bacterium]|nr:dTDP-glucose 4,6-dehydratase [Cytophagales bacterium]
MEKNILITGGAGFIGSHVVKLFVNKYPHYKIFNLDKLTYAGNLANLKDIEEVPNYTFIKGDIAEPSFIDGLFGKYKFNSIIHLAAESHVDRSIVSPMDFIQTNIIGTVNLLNAARQIWEKYSTISQNLESKTRNPKPETRNLFYHISTDEVYGSLDDSGFFIESTPYDPRSPYSASKASSDHFVRAYHNTYKLPFVISNCSNNYGPNQFPEKLIPLCINNIKNNKPLPIYGRGENIRDWLYVEDHARAIDLIFHKGNVGDTYNVGGVNEWKNIDLIRLLCRIMDKKTGRPAGSCGSLITFVKDRQGHDLRYAIDASKIMNELGWKPSLKFEAGLEKTVDWYLANQQWLESVTSGAYQKYYQEQYG